MKILKTLIILAAWLWPAGAAGGSAQAAQPEAVVRAILFYSPNCGHCHYVISEVLPPLFEQYGGQLYMVGVDTSQAGGNALFISALQYFNLDTSGVPFLVVGDTYLVGSRDIPEQFPGLVAEYLAQGGVDWPAIPGVAEAMMVGEATQAAAGATEPPTQELASTAQASPTARAATETQPSATQPAATATPNPAGLILANDSQAGPLERLGRDPVGNGLALVVLAGMVLSVVGAGFSLRQAPGVGRGRLEQPVRVEQPVRTDQPVRHVRWEWAVPILCVIGLGVAGYLAFVETAQVEAVCGPVGDCNTVQQSEYARLFGVIPIGVLGLVGYVVILVAWGIGRYGSPRWAGYAWLALFGLAAFGVLFSIWLTYLEPFVIGATCAWCLTSAIIMTALFWLSLEPARTALPTLHKEKK